MQNIDTRKILYIAIDTCIMASLSMAISGRCLLMAMLIQACRRGFIHKKNIIKGVKLG